MNINLVAMIVGFTMCIGSLLKYDVIGHWWHRWELVHGRGSMPNFANYYECRTCGKRKVSRRTGEVLWDEQRWIDHEEFGKKPWELGDPPSTWPMLDTGRKKKKGEIKTLPPRPEPSARDWRGEAWVRERESLRVIRDGSPF